jgi:hypothetical protein
MTKMTKQEKEWRAESDAHTLITAEAIMSDSVRKKLALQKVKTIADEREKEAKAAKRVANKKRTTRKRKATKKNTRSRRKK